jgi:signal transduction histidine kinase
MTKRDGDSTAGERVRANRYDVLSRLAEDLAHEIKNPLNSIVINLEVVRRMMATGAHERVLDRTAVIEQEVLRVHELIDEMLQLLRPVKSASALVAVDGLIGSVQNALQVQAKGARVGLDIEAENSLYARIHPEPFKFALLNLMTHAIDAEAEAGGAVSLAARLVGESIEVTVTCSHATLAAKDEQIEFCRTLLDAAGGRLESLEPGNAGGGSITTLVVPPANF